jgi:predicted permease
MSGQPHPPRPATWLLARFVRADERAMVLGDFVEQFQQHRESTGRWRAALWCWREVAQLAWGFLRWTPRPRWTSGRVVIVDDIRYAMRRLQKQPLATVASVTTLACAVGAAAATWSLLSAVLFNPLHLPNPERVVDVGAREPGRENNSGYTYPAYQLLRNAAPMPVAGWGAINPRTPLIVETTAGAHETSARFTSANFLAVLGLEPRLGRYFTEAESGPGEPLVVVLSDRFWRTGFQSDPDVVGRAIRIRDEQARIIGVAPRGFTGLEVGRAPDLFMPLESMERVQQWKELYTDRPPVNWMDLVGRLPDGMALAGMQDRMNGLQLDSIVSLKGTHTVLTDVETASLSASSRVDVRKFSAILGATVVLLLTVGSLTVGMLLVMRTEARSNEFATCLALGASRARLAMSVVVEGVILAVLGTLLALPVCRLMFAGISAFQLPGGIRVQLLSLSIDGTVMAAAAGAALASILLMGAVAGMVSLRGGLGDIVRAHAGSTRVSRRRSRAALVTAQVAVTLVLVSGAGLFASSVARALAINPGLETRHLLRGEVTLGGYDVPRMDAFFEALRARLAQQPSIASFGFGTSKVGLGFSRVDGELRKWPSSMHPVAVDGRYLSTIGLPILTGRGFVATDTAGAPTVAIVNVWLARAIAGEGSALGHRIGPDSAGGRYAFPEAEIVGVVPDIRLGTGSEHPLNLYLPDTQYTLPVYQGSGGQTLVVRASGSPRNAARAIADTIRSLDPTIRLRAFPTIDEGLMDEMAPQRFGMTVMGSLGTIALLLTVLGTYVLAESVGAERRREMGIRAALGARSAELRRLMLSETIRLVGIGLAIGFGLAWLGAGTIRAFLFQVDPFDPLVTGGVALTIIVLALAVSLRPALAAARIDLARVLRED